MNKMKIFIGTENGHEKAEKALEWSIINTSSIPFEIIWMKDGQGDIWSNWNKGRNHLRQNSGEGWKTNFSCYRWAIPELCSFGGRGIYLDVDQIVLKDLKEMWELDLQDYGALAITNERTDVMVMNCEKFSGDWWPRIKSMKPSGKHQKHYRLLVQNKGLIGPLDGKYNCLDGDGFSNITRLVHFTKITTQPWHPAPENIQYKPHKSPFLEKLWWNKYYEAVEYEKNSGVIFGANNNKRI